ncbi:MAG: acyltransferase family protein [Lachnospiraceae bacterium]|nr:acyltransferase family protein [Lachnospiraceae bacterium]
MKTRKTYIDFIRILAILMVVFVHTGPEASQRYSVVPSGSFTYWFSVALNTLTQTCAPLFFMVTGAVLLHKKETLEDVLLHRALKFFVILMVFGLIEYAYFYHLNPEITFSIPTFFYLAYSTTVIHQFWFLYAYLGFLLVLPFIRMMAQNMEDKHFWYLAGLMLVLEGICPIIEYLWGNSRIALPVPFLTNVIIYPLMGYFIEHRFDKKHLIIVNLFGLAAFVTNSVIGHMAIAQRGDVEALGGMTFVIAVVLFVDIKALFEKWPASERSAKAISFLGAGSICVFLLEPPLRDTFKVVYEASEPYITWFPASLLWIMCACLAGILIYHLLRLIPGVKRVL